MSSGRWSVRLVRPPGDVAPRVGIFTVLLAPGAALAVSPAPVWLRATLALPALVLGAGAALGLLVIAPDGGPGPDRPDAPASATPRVGALLWWTFAVLLGFLVVLADALLLNLLRIRLTALALAVGVEATGAVLLMLGLVAVGGRTVGTAALPRTDRRSAAVAGILAVTTLAVLGGAVAVARVLQPSGRTAYGVLSLAGGDRDGELVATPGGPVTVDWSLQGYEGFDVARAGSLTGMSLTDLRTGRVRPVLSHAAPARDTDGDGHGERTGRSTFTAPAVAGTYEVALGLEVPAAAGGPSELDLTAVLTVRR